MSEEEVKEESRMQSYSTYDYKDVVKGIEVSTVYIHALERIITDMITKDESIAVTIGETFQKFNQIVEANQKFIDPKTTDEEKEEIQKNTVKLNKFESDVYTLFSLLQQIKFRAREQNLEQKTETSATKEDIKELTEMMMAGKSVTSKLESLKSKMSIVK
tara:strand:+ start:3304 stop:3783 length:480 start_codon:yes stop_codon:yes gene_type:complete